MKAGPRLGELTQRQPPWKNPWQPAVELQERSEEDWPRARETSDVSSLYSKSASLQDMRKAKAADLGKGISQRARMYVDGLR